MTKITVPADDFQILEMLSYHKAVSKIAGKRRNHMSIIKNEIPILEFDTEQTAVISPVHENLNLVLPKQMDVKAK